MPTNNTNRPLKLEMDKDLSFQINKKIFFSIDKHNLPIKKYIPLPLCVVIGITQDNFIYPKAFFKINNISKNCNGWYNEVRIYEFNNDSDITFSIKSDSKNITLHWWFEEISSTKSPVEPFSIKSPDSLRYDIGLHWIPTLHCNFNCFYCNEKKSSQLNHINIPALMQNIDNCDKTFKFTFTGGGEPFLVPNIVEACLEITKNNYIAFTTNGISNKLKHIAQRIDPENIDFIVASLHITEIEKHDLLSRYIDNFIACRAAGISIKTHVVAHPSFINLLKKYKNIFDDKNILIYFTPFIGKYDNKIYPQEYTESELNYFSLVNTDNNIYSQKSILCNAGYNTGVIWDNGDVHTCYSKNEYLGNIYTKINFKNLLTNCSSDFCRCPLNKHDQILYDQALEQTNSGRT